jgi:flagellar hook-length control protein FliK
LQAAGRRPITHKGTHVDAITLAAPATPATPSASASSPARQDEGDRTGFEAALDQARGTQDTKPSQGRAAANARQVRLAGRGGAASTQGRAQGEMAVPDAGNTLVVPEPTVELEASVQPRPADPAPDDNAAKIACSHASLDPEVRPPFDTTVAVSEPVPQAQRCPLEDPGAIGPSVDEAAPEVREVTARPAPPVFAVREAAENLPRRAAPRAVNSRAGIAASDNPAPPRELGGGDAATAAVPDIRSVVQEEQDPGQAPALESLPAGFRSQAAATLPAGRAYQRASRALESGSWAEQGLAAATAALAKAPRETPEPVSPAASTPTPAPFEPQAGKAGVSAHATAFLRSLGINVSATGAEAEARAAESMSPVADVMAGVAMEFAAANAGDSRHNSESGSSNAEKHDAARRPDAGGSLSHTPPAFSVPTQAAAPAPAESAVGAAVTPETRPTQEPTVTGQVVKAVALAWRDGVGEARIRLTPEHLGEVLVTMKVDRGQVVAQIVAETPAARAWIESHQQDLRDGLLAQGLQLDRLVVTADGQRQQQPNDDGAERQRRARPRPPRGGNPAARFELVV